MYSITSRSQGEPAMTSDDVQRTILPIPDLAYTGTVTYDATSPDTSFPPIRRLLPPEGAPNVLVDPDRRRRLRRVERVRRPGARRRPSSASRPTGLKYTRFHTTALCSPTRAALLSGRNHHTVGHGRHHRDRDVARRATTRCGRTPARRSPRSLKLNGYSTAQFGKCHEVPVWEASPVGPFDHWPHPGRRLRVLLRVHRRRDQPVVPGDLREHHRRSSRGARPKRATTSWTT